MNGGAEQIRKRRNKWVRVLLTLLLLGAIVGAIGWYKFSREVDQHFDSMEAYFKNGSIGTEQAEGIPYWIWAVLPRMFPEYLPGPGGYNSLGLFNDPGNDIPAGFSKKTIGFERVGVNCAFCHLASVRYSSSELPILYPAGPSNTVDVLGYQRFLFRSASDPRFNAKNILAQVDSIYKLSFLDRLIYKYALIPATKKALLKQKEKYAWTDVRPYWGLGRIDPFNPVKVNVLDVYPGDTTGNSDMQPIWNLGAHKGMSLHWDGLNTDLKEVVLSSAIGDGATKKSIPLAQLQKLQDWLCDLKPPRYPADRFPVDTRLAGQGQQLFARDCAGCHAFGGKRTGQVISASETGPDAHRVAIWTKEAASRYNSYAEGYEWKFNHFRSTDGYQSVPLDGIWIRGPYLHNGSVPTLRDLLEPVENRPKVFYRGYNVLDPKKVGFIATGAEAERVGWRYDTSVVANSNAGHLWGTNLAPSEKDALVEYMKTQ